MRCKIRATYTFLFFLMAVMACQPEQTNNMQEDQSLLTIESKIVRDQVGGMKTAFLSAEDQDSLVWVNMKFRFGNEQNLMNRDVAGDFAGQLLIKGTQHRNGAELEQVFKDLGANVNVTGNVYSASVSMEVESENLYEALNVLQEVLREPAYSKDEFEAHKQEILTIVGDFKDDASSIAGRRMGQYMNRLPAGHPNYSGSLEESLKAIGAVTLDETKAFYKDFYGASNVEITVVGNVDRAEMNNWLDTSFGDWESPSPFKKVAIPYEEIPPIRESISFPVKAKANIGARQNLPMSQDHPDYPALLLGAYILGNPAYQESRLANIYNDHPDGDRLMSVFFSDPIEQLGGFMVFGNFESANLKQIEEVFDTEVARFISEGFTQEEVEGAQAHWLASREYLRTNYSRLASHINNGLFSGRTLQWDADLENRMKALTPEDISNAVKRHIKPEAMSVISAGRF